MLSPLDHLLSRLTGLDAMSAHVALDALLDEHSVAELGAALYDWSLHAREGQRIPDGDWQTWGLLGARGWGKTRSTTSHALEEIETGRAMRVALVGQSDLAVRRILVQGDTGLLACASPWLKAELVGDEVRFANGAVASIYSAQEPAQLRGVQHHLSIATELSSWPASSRQDTWSQIETNTRLGYGRIIWDTTPKRGSNELIKTLVAQHEADPARHGLTRGTVVENELALPPGYIDGLRRKYEGTVIWRQEFEAEILGEGEGLFRAGWMQAAPLPEHLTCRILSVDPASTSNRRADSTGAVEVARASDGRILAVRNLSMRESPATCFAKLVDHYLAERLDMLLVETNRGQEMITGLIDDACRRRGARMTSLADGVRPLHREGVVNVRTFTARGSKGERAMLASSLVQTGEVLFVRGALGDLEERLLAFNGADNRPDDSVDAFAAGVTELHALFGRNAPQPASLKDFLEFQKRAPQRRFATPPKINF